MLDSDTPIAWTAMPHRAPVLAADGTRMGTAESVLGDEEADIFHGIVLRRTAGDAVVEVPAARITRMTASHVLTDLGPDEVKELPRHRGQRWWCPLL